MLAHPPSREIGRGVAVQNGAFPILRWSADVLSQPVVVAHCRGYWFGGIAMDAIVTAGFYLVTPEKGLLPSFADTLLGQMTHPVQPIALAKVIS